VDELSFDQVMQGETIGWKVTWSLIKGHNVELNLYKMLIFTVPI